MPPQALWFSNLSNILDVLRSSCRDTIDRQTLQDLLGVGRRRAQQILAPCITERVGANGLADRKILIRHLEQLARGEDVTYEVRRRQRLGKILADLRRQRLEQPQLLVEAPSRVVNQTFASLPPGVRLEPGRITVEFSEPKEALEKLLALAMAAGRDWEEFERSVS